MNIIEKDKYKKIPISDQHVHLWAELPIKDTFDFHMWILNEFGYETVSLNSLPDGLIVPRAKMPNLKIMYIKKLCPTRFYTHAGLRFDDFSETDNGDYFLNQVKYYDLCGYDGMKMFYNPDIYLKGFPYIRLSDHRYDKMFEYMEREQFPLIIHVANPEMCFGDINKMPESQKKWHLGHTGLKFEDMIGDFTSMMDKFPDLRVTIAHFGFITWHMDWAKQWLEKYKNLYFDLTPNPFMYVDFQDNPTEWTEFFIKNSKRIIFGTDIGSNTYDTERKEPAALVHLIRGFFEETEPFTEFGIEFTPMPIPDEHLRNIYRESMLEFRQNHAPRIADFERLAFEIRTEDSGDLSELACQNLEIMKHEFSRG